MIPRSTSIDSIDNVETARQQLTLKSLLDHKQDDIFEETNIFPYNVLPLDFMFNVFECSITNSHVCEVSILLHMEVEEDPIQYPVIENLNDENVEDEIRYFYFGNNLEQTPLSHDLSLVRDLHDNVPLENTSFEIAPLKVDEDHSKNREAFHCLHSKIFYSLYPYLFSKHNSHIDIQDSIFETPLWLDTHLVQINDKLSLSNEGTSVTLANPFLNYQGENDIFVNVFDEHMHVVIVELMKF